jgi:hypothetical protein
MAISTVLTMDLQINMKKNHKVRKKKPYRYVLLFIDWRWFKFYAILLLFDNSSKTIKLELWQST